MTQFTREPVPYSTEHIDATAMELAKMLGVLKGFIAPKLEEQDELDTNFVPVPRDDEPAPVQHSAICDECSGCGYTGEATSDGVFRDDCHTCNGHGTVAITHSVPAQQEPPRFPTVLRKMWSGSEVQAWINENWSPAPQPAPVANNYSDADVLKAHTEGYKLGMMQTTAAPEKQEPDEYTKLIERLRDEYCDAVARQAARAIESLMAERDALRAELDALVCTHGVSMQHNCKQCERASGAGAAPAPQPAQQEPEIPHCEAGEDYCPQCLVESHSLALAAAIRYVDNNTPKLVSSEIRKALYAAPVAQPEQQEPTK